MKIDPAWLAPTWYIDSDSPEISRYAEAAVGKVTDPVEIMRRLFHQVRDGIRYDPYVMQYDHESYRASVIAGGDSNWCIPKSILLVACARHKGIPARLGFADVRNHLTSEKLSATMGTDLFAWHGYAEVLIEGRWLKLSTAFNKELCAKFGTKVLEFDPEHNSLMHPFDESGRRHMEYVNHRGSYNDLPLEEILETFLELYPNWERDEDGGYSHSTANAAERDEVFSQ